MVKKIPEGKDSKATPWFNQKGGGDQTETEKGIGKLVTKDKVLEHIKSE